jgi:4-hydroxy-2-oxoheptanedioate aldolase
MGGVTRSYAAQQGLRAGRPILGCFLRYPEAGLAELLALQGLDFVIFDGEHGPLTPPLCEQLARATQLHEVTAGVRVEENRPASILRYLDAGAQICHIPGVDSRQDAERAVRSVKFRPGGDRGLSASRASDYGASGGYAAYIEEANRESIVVAHIESAAGVEAAPEIAVVEGVDVLLAGTLDLSHDLGLAGQLDHPSVQEGARRIAAAAADAGKTLGVVVADRAGAEAWIAKGAGYVLTTVESFITPAAKSFVGGDRRADR